MKKLICILLGLLMLLSLAACGTQKAGPADSGPKEDPGASAPAGTGVPEADKSEVPADTGTETGDSEAETADEAFTITDLADRTVTFDRPVSRFIDQSSGSGGAFSCFRFRTCCRKAGGKHNRQGKGCKLLEMFHK